MSRKKKQTEIVVICDYCKEETGIFVASYPDYLKFCRIHTPGKEPEKDCMTEYYKEKKQNVQKKEKQEQSLFY